MTSLKLAVRQLLKTPGFTFVVVATLAIGIGANAIVYSWIETVLLKAVPGAGDPQELVAIAPMNDQGRTGAAMSFPDLRDLDERSNTLEGVAGADNALINFRHGNSTDWIWGQVVTDQFFDVLEVRPLRGRLDFPGTDLDIDNAPFAVISHASWIKRFQGADSIVGTEIMLNETPFTIIGVAPEGFKGSMGGLTFEIWIPMSMSESMGLGPGLSDERRGWHWINGFGRLREGIDRAEAQVDTHTIAAGIAASDPNAGPHDTFELIPMWKAPDTGQEIFLPLLRLLVVVATLVLMLVTANIANLMLARSTERHHELGVRLAMGATRFRVLCQLVRESLLLTALGTVAGIALARFGGWLLQGFIPNSHLPAGYDVEITWRVITLTAGLAAVTGLVFGLAPVAQLLRLPLTRLMGGGSRTATEGGRERLLLRRVLVAGQFAIAMVLLVCAGLCLRSFSNARKLDLGFNPTGVWVAGFRLDAIGYSAAEADGFYRRLKERVEALPGVGTMAYTDYLPLGFEDGASGGLSIPGYQPRPGEQLGAGLARVTPDFFATMEIPLLAGRDFNPGDNGESEPVVIINQTMMDRYFDGRDPLGRKVGIWGPERTVIGVVGDTKSRELNEPPANMVYAPRAQLGPPNVYAVVRSAGDPRPLGAAVQRIARELDPVVEVWHSTSFKDFIEPAFLLPRISATLLAILGGVAIILASLGIYAVIAFSVARRTREIGIRLALGCGRSGIETMVVKQGMRMVAVGFLLGLVVALGIARLLSGFLLKVTPFDPVTLLSAGGVLLIVALLACWIPARRAARIDPMKALRSE